MIGPKLTSKFDFCISLTPFFVYLIVAKKSIENENICLWLIRKIYEYIIKILKAYEFFEQLNKYGL